MSPNLASKNYIKTDYNRNLEAHKWYADWGDTAGDVIVRRKIYRPFAGAQYEHDEETSVKDIFHDPVVPWMGSTSLA